MQNENNKLAIIKMVLCMVLFVRTFKYPEVPLASRWGPDPSTDSSPLSEFRVKMGARELGETKRKKKITCNYARHDELEHLSVIFINT